MHPTFHKALNMFRQFLIACLLPLSFFATAAQADVLYYNIAHAVNHSKYIDWAVSNGANGIEADLRFTDNGDVLKFQHGTICECQFPTGWYAWNETDICVQMMSVSHGVELRSRFSRRSRSAIMSTRMWALIVASVPRALAAAT